MTVNIYDLRPDATNATWIESWHDGCDIVIIKNTLCSRGTTLKQELGERVVEYIKMENYNPWRNHA